MSVRPRSQRRPAQVRRVEKFVQKAFMDDITAKAALLVIHRVARSMVKMENAADAQKQQKALDQLIKFADAHPLAPELEGLL